MPRVFVSIGSNQRRERNIRAAVAALVEQFGAVVLSSVYETEAVGFSGDPFFNLVAEFETERSVDSVLDVLRAIETRCGRVRVEKRYGPRTLDIDVLTYGDVICEDEPVELPRSEILTQAYVLKPLAELAPGALHPILGERYADLWSRLGLSESGIVRTDFDARGGLQSR